MLVPILRDQGVQQGVREMASSYQIQDKLKEMKEQLHDQYKQMVQENTQRFTDLLKQVPNNEQQRAGIGGGNTASGSSGAALDGGGGGAALRNNNLNDAPRTPQSCHSDRRFSIHCHYFIHTYNAPQTSIISPRKGPNIKIDMKIEQKLN